MSFENPEDAAKFYGERKAAYQLVFNTPAGRAVLADLAPFCRTLETCVAARDESSPIDVYRTFLLEGRRDVFLRIQLHLERTPDELAAIYTRPAKGAISHARSDPSESDPTA